MSFTESISTVYRKYAVFNGRASRAEFWWFQLFFIVTYFALLTVLVTVSGSEVIAGTLAVITFAFVVGSLIPSLAVTVRRLHDANFSGFLWFVALIPIFGALILIVLTLLPSVNIDNKYS
jgi:uncharacterized membrane protein YhaH (DUF805 family)